MGYEEGLISFLAGMAYGATRWDLDLSHSQNWFSVLVGQPVDTVKTRMQAMPE